MTRSVAEMLKEVDDKLRTPLCCYLRRRFPGLSSEDLADTWAETLASLYFRLSQAVSESTSETVVEDLAPLVKTVAYRRAIDRIRQTTARANAVVTAFDEITATPDVTSHLESRDLLQRVKQQIELLPKKQRIVMQQLIRGYPATRSMATLCEAVVQATGEPTTIGAVKRNLHEARAKLRAFLEQQGD